MRCSFAGLRMCVCVVVLRMLRVCISNRRFGRYRAHVVVNAAVSIVPLALKLIKIALALTAGNLRRNMNST